jgi:hypothetical protein
VDEVDKLNRLFIILASCFQTTLSSYTPPCAYVNDAHADPCPYGRVYLESINTTSEL